MRSPGGRRAGGADLSLVAVTGYGQDEDQRRCRTAGFDHHLVKPVDPQALSRLLTSMPATAGHFAAWSSLDRSSGGTSHCLAGRRRAADLRLRHVDSPPRSRYDRPHTLVLRRTCRIFSMNGNERIIRAGRGKNRIGCRHSSGSSMPASVRPTDSEDPVEIVDRLDLDGINIRPDYRKQFLDDKRLSDEWQITRPTDGDALPGAAGQPHRRHHPSPRVPLRSSACRTGLPRSSSAGSPRRSAGAGIEPARRFFRHARPARATKRADGLLLEPQAFREPWPRGRVQPRHGGRRPASVRRRSSPRPTMWPMRAAC